jgi:DNA repair photolyase
MVKVQEVRAKSVLNKSKIFDFCLNPYIGCELNCAYCYARLFMKRYSGHREAWGKFVDVKVNAPEILKRQLDKARRGIVWVSSVCDPYQPLEASLHDKETLCELRGSPIAQGDEKSCMPRNSIAFLFISVEE